MLAALLAAAAAAFAQIAPARAAARRRRPQIAPTRACGSCSTTATRTISAATRSPACSAATIATPPISATISATPISPPSAPPPSTTSPRSRAIDRDALDPTDRLAYDVFKYQRENDLADVQPDMLALTAVRPINHFSGFHTFYPVFASGHGAAPFRNVEDYENNLTRHREFASLIDRAIGRFREGLASGVVETKLTIRNVIDQLDTQLRDAPEASPYYAPVLTFPDAVPEADRARLRAAYLAVDPRQHLPGLPAAARLPPERLSAARPRRRRPRPRCAAATGSTRA